MRLFDWSSTVYTRELRMASASQTLSVSAVTDQFKSSYMSTCLTGLVKSWNFPKHKYQPGEPVDFPFTF